MPTIKSVKQPPTALGQRAQQLARETAEACTEVSQLTTSAADFWLDLAGAGRLMALLLALISSLTAFSLWWVLCYYLGPSPWLFLPALLLAQPLTLGLLSCKLAAGALLAAQRPDSGVDLERLKERREVER